MKTINDKYYSEYGYACFYYHLRQLKIFNLKFTVSTKNYQTNIFQHVANKITNRVITRLVKNQK